MVAIGELEDTFWGVVLKGKTQYEHKSERPVHLSMAALDTTSTHDLYVPVMVQQGSHSYILCTLHAPNYLQQTLDLEINKGESITFSLNSNGAVHLTGYYIPEEPMDDLEDENNDMMNYMHAHDENCNHPEIEGFDNEDDDSDDDGEEGDEDDMDSEDFDEDGDDDDDDDDDEEEEEEEVKEATNGKKRKLEIKKIEPKKQLKNNKKAKKEESEEEEEEQDEAPQLVKVSEKPAKGKKDEDKKVKKDDTTQTKTVTVNGIQLKDLKVGTGPEAKKGKYVHVYYQGKLKQNGKQFDACQSGKPFKFRLGSGEVIKGWDIGVAGMKVGGKRVLTIPPNQAYGNQKLGGIPSNSTLVFEVELKAIS